ncbi:AbiJ-related protein [Streptomyces sp. NPDC054871]
MRPSRCSCAGGTGSPAFELDQASARTRCFLGFCTGAPRQFFEQLGCFTAPHPRFARFVEALAAASTLRDEPAQRRFVALANHHLQPIGVRLQ